jgi:hypothetical protein
MFGTTIDIRGKVTLKTYFTAYEAEVKLYVVERLEGTFNVTVQNPHDANVKLVVTRGGREILNVQGEMTEDQYRKLSAAKQALLGVATLVLTRGIEMIEAQYPSNISTRTLAEKFSQVVGLKAEASVSLQVGLSMDLLSACYG